MCLWGASVREKWLNVLHVSFFLPFRQKVPVPDSNRFGVTSAPMQHCKKKNSHKVKQLKHFLIYLDQKLRKLYNKAPAGYDK